MEAEAARVAITEAQEMVAAVLKELQDATGLNVGNIKLDVAQESFGDDDLHIEIQMYLMGA